VVVFFSKIVDFKAFLELITLEGKESLLKSRYSEFIESILLKEAKSLVEQNRTVASSILLAQYCLAPYEESKNHVAMVEGWTILLSYVLSLVEKSELKADFSQSIKLIEAGINSELEFLKEEYLSKEKHVESWDFNRLYQSRLTIVLGWLAAGELYKLRLDPEYTPDDGIYDNIKKNYIAQTWFWGESATPSFLMFSLLAEKKGDRALSIKILTDIIIEIINLNGFREKNSIADPYYSAERILNHYFGPKSAKIDLSGFSGRSYHLSTLVDFLVRRKRRDILSELWKGISQVMNSQFKPSFAWESF
jgi:hypothetical protein